MFRGPNTPDSATPTPGAALGFRRVEHVHISLRPGATIAEVTGIVNRYPRTVRVPLHLAAALIADGVPHTIETDGASRRDREAV